MTFGPVSAWLVWGVLALAPAGLWMVLETAWQLARYLAERWRDRRDFGPDEESEQELSGLCYGCWENAEHCDGTIDTCACTCTWPEGWAEQPEEFPPLGLPPERTWEQMTSHQLPVIGPRYDQEAHDRQMQEGILGLRPERERRAPWWEAEHRAAYESLGFDYPSGLVARVRELTP